MPDRTLENEEMIEELFGPGSSWTRRRTESLKNLRKVYGARKPVRNGDERAKEAWRAASALMTELAGMLEKRGSRPKAEIRRRMAELARTVEQAPEGMRQHLRTMLLDMMLEELGRAFGL